MFPWKKSTQSTSLNFKIGTANLLSFFSSGSNLEHPTFVMKPLAPSDFQADAIIRHKTTVRGQWCNQETSGFFEFGV